MDLEIRDKVYLITGGANGIGEAICRRLAQEKAIPVIIDKNQAKAENLAGDLISKSRKCHIVIRELSTEESCASAVKESLSKTGRINGLVNNAGINDTAGLTHGSGNEFLRSLERNLHHYYFMVHACLPELKRNRGAVINISSKTALTGQGNTSGYAASKGAQLALTREWAAELLGDGIRVNAIVPSEVYTPLYEQWLKNSFKDPQKKKKEIEKKIPLGNRFTTPAEIADMAVFLVSARAGHVTGQHIHVDGGYVHLDRAIEG